MFRFSAGHVTIPVDLRRVTGVMGWPVGHGAEMPLARPPPTLLSCVSFLLSLLLSVKKAVFQLQPLIPSQSLSRLHRPN